MISQKHTLSDRKCTSKRQTDHDSTEQTILLFHFLPEWHICRQTSLPNMLLVHQFKDFFFLFPLNGIQKLSDKCDPIWKPSFPTYLTVSQTNCKNVDHYLQILLPVEIYKQITSRSLVMAWIWIAWRSLP